MNSKLCTAWNGSGPSHPSSASYLPVASHPSNPSSTPHPSSASYLPVASHPSNTPSTPYPSSAPYLPDRTSGRYVYGLTLHGLDHVGELLSVKDPGRIDDGSGLGVIEGIRVDQRDRPSPTQNPSEKDHLVRRLADGRHLELSLRRRRATFYGSPLEPDLLAHPYLGPVAVTFNRWAGREAFHAAAFVVGGRAWIVMGGRTAGKSTLMGALAGADIPVLADDIVITDGRYVYAGPRCLDLREPVPGLPLEVRQSRLDTRFRVSLPASPARVRLGGWIFLRWDEETALTPVAATELLGRVAARRSLPLLPTDPRTVFSLATLPAWDFGRPQDWGTLRSSTDVLLDKVSGMRDAAVGR